MPDTATTPLLTRALTDQARDNLNTVELAYRELATTTEIATRTRDTATRGRGGIHPPSPSPEVEHADDIMRTLWLLEDAMRQWRGDAPSPHGPGHDRHGTVVRAAAAYLRRVENDVCGADFATDDGNPFALRYAKELARLASRCEQLRGGGTGREDWCTYSGAICPACHAEALKQLAGTDDLVCRHCGEKGSVAEVEGYREWLRQGGRAAMTA